MLDGRQVRRISAYLVEGDLDDAPVALAANAERLSLGSIVLGMGFTFDDAAAAKGEADTSTTCDALIAKDPRNAERIFPYLGARKSTTDLDILISVTSLILPTFPCARDRICSMGRIDGQQNDEWLTSGIVPADYPDPVAETGRICWKS